MSDTKHVPDLEKGEGGASKPGNGGAKKAELDDTEKKHLEGSLETTSNVLCSLFGHDFHWTEIFFIVMFILGVVLTSHLNAGGEFPPVLIVMAGALTALIAFAYVWNLCPNRLLAAITAKLAATVERYAKENKRALENCKNLAEGNKQLKGHVSSLGETRKMLGKTNVEMGEVEKKGDEILEKLREVTEQRQQLGNRLKDILAKDSSNATRQAILNLVASIMGQITEAEMNKGSTIETQMTTLAHALKVENIDFDRKEFEAGMFAPPAGKAYSHYDLYQRLEEHLVAHFKVVDERYCEVTIKQQELASIRKQTKAQYQQYLEDKALAYEEQLNSYLKDPSTSMSSAVGKIVGAKK